MTNQAVKLTSLLILCAVVFLPAVQANAQTETETDINARIAETIAAMKSEPDGEVRARHAWALHVYLSGPGRDDLSSIDDISVGGVAQFLSDNESIVHFRVARALGSMGPAAASAVPALQAALHNAIDELRREPEGPAIQYVIRGPGPESNICKAFQSIGVNPEPEICVDGYFIMPSSRPG